MEPGTTLGHYEVLSLLGKGGMGEVWRAKDTKLGREVAIKTLPEEFAKDADRLARFEREAKLLASLNHPNIAAIYGLEERQGTRFLVLELVEGPTLGDRIKQGAIPVEESLNLALQIAEALEAAHERGVIHRDLKPDNIKVTPDGKVKVLDFGLAKAFAGEEAGANLSQSPTLSMAATQQGIILGTAAYMSPEQAVAAPTDKRADIWSFGVVLFEMLTGRQVFTGETAPHILAAVLRAEPEWSGLPLNLHPRIRLLLERCLEKRVKDRSHDIGDARVDIQKVLADPSGVLVQPIAEGAQATRQSKLPWVAAFALGLGVASTAVWVLSPFSDVVPAATSRFYHLLPEDQAFTNAGRPVLALSPDGSKIVYTSNNQLYLREMGTLESIPIPGTFEGVESPVFSPDGQWIAYWAGPALKKIPLTGGTSVTLAQVGRVFSTSWSDDDSILLGQLDGIVRVPANGGMPELLVATEPGEQADGPQILPGGEWLLFSFTEGEGATRWDAGQIVIQSLDSDERKVLWQGGSDARYVPTGHLIYSQGNSLFALPFDLTSLEVTGGPVPIVENVKRSANPITNGATANYAFSAQGTLVYVPDFPSVSANRVFALVDRIGTMETLNVPPAPYVHPRLSPDGDRLVVEVTTRNNVANISGDDSDIWIYDLSGNTQVRPLTQGGNGTAPIWTPDGDKVTFASNRDGPLSLYWQPVDGSGVAERLTMPDEALHIPLGWSPDGRTLAVRNISNSDSSIWTLSLDGDGELEPFYDIPDGSDQRAASFSPDGRWIAFHSDGAAENDGQVYVLPFPATGVEPQRITQEGGVFPIWSPEGDELFYRRPVIGTQNTEARIVAVDVASYGPFAVGPERDLPIQDFLIANRDYDISPDGQRFLVVIPEDQDAAERPRPQINIVLNWFEELKERVPVP